MSVLKMWVAFHGMYVTEFGINQQLALLEEENIEKKVKNIIAHFSLFFIKKFKNK